MDRRELLKNLVAMAAVDGSFTEREVHFLCDRCVEWGIDDPGFADVLAEVVADPSREIVVPETKESCVELLQELIRMMAADGQLVDTEKTLFAAAAGQMNISTEELDALIDAVLGND